MKQTKFLSQLRCPNCRSRNLYVNEWGECVTQFFQNDGVIDITQSNNEPGSTFKVTSECQDCGHVWRVRNAVTILSVIPDYGKI